MFVFFVLCWDMLSFCFVTMVNRKIKKCQYFLIYDKFNGDVAM